MEEEEQENPKKEKNLKELLADMAEKLESSESKKKEKKFKLPFMARLSKKNIKDGLVTCIIVHTNKNLEFKKLPIVDNVARHEDSFHKVTSENILLYKNKPIVIITKWNSLSWNPEGDFAKATDEKTLTSGQKLVMARMLSDTIKDKPKIPGKIIIYVILAIIVGYVIMNAGIF